MYWKNNNRWWGRQIEAKYLGAALLEFALVAPLLLLLSMAAIHAGMALDQYMRILDAVHAGVRIGQKQIGLTVGSVTTSFVRENGECRIGLSDPAVENSLHMSIHRRVNRVLCIERAPLQNIQIESELLESTSGKSLVQVRISGGSISIFPWLGTIPIAVEASGPYLVSEG